MGLEGDAAPEEEKVEFGEGGEGEGDDEEASEEVVICWGEAF